MRKDLTEMSEASGEDEGAESSGQKTERRLRKEWRDAVEEMDGEIWYSNYQADNANFGAEIRSEI